MRLGHVLLRQFYARNAFGIQTSIFHHSDKVRSGSAALGAALGAAGLFIWMPSSALLESHTDESGPCSEQSKYFPDIFSRKGINSGQQEPYVAYNREGQTVPLGEIVQRMEVHCASIRPQSLLQLDELPQEGSMWIVLTESTVNARVEDSDAGCRCSPPGRDA